MRATWDIFCSVVDNYGDIGVTWRLARQLVAEHGCRCGSGSMICRHSCGLSAGGSAMRQATAGWCRGLPVAGAVAARGGCRCGDRGLRLSACPEQHTWQTCRPRPQTPVAESGIPECRKLGGRLPWLAVPAIRRIAEVFLLSPAFVEGTGGFVA
jgi:hypothetical protein